MSATPIGCDGVRDDLYARALGALDPGDSRRVDQHVAGCADCRRLLDEARAYAAALALAVSMTSAGPGARVRVLNRVEAMGVPDLSSRRRSVNPWWLAAAAVLVAALAGVSAWLAVTQRHVDNLERDRDAARTQVAVANARGADALAARRAILDVMAQPDAVHVSLHGVGSATSASALYLWSSSRSSGVLAANGLPQLTEAETYQAWIVYATSWESAGTFSVDASGAGALLVSHDGGESGPPQWYCVTVEPAGGSAKHTGPMVLSSLP